MEVGKWQINKLKLIDLVWMTWPKKKMPCVFCEHIGFSTILKSFADYVPILVCISVGLPLSFLHDEINIYTYLCMNKLSYMNSDNQILSLWINSVQSLNTISNHKSSLITIEGLDGLITNPTSQF